MNICVTSWIIWSTDILFFIDSAIDSKVYSSINAYLTSPTDSELSVNYKVFKNGLST